MLSIKPFKTSTKSTPNKFITRIETLKVNNASRKAKE